MDLTLYLIVSAVMAIGVVIIRAIYGGEIVRIIKRVAFLALVLPILAIAIFGMIDMMNANQEETRDCE
jgi:hypothetical protein